MNPNIDTMLSAIRFKDDYSIFKKGEVYTISEDTYITGLNKDTCYHLLAAIWDAVCGRPSPVELNYKRNMASYPYGRIRYGIYFIFLDFSEQAGRRVQFFGEVPHREDIWLTNFTVAVDNDDFLKVHNLLKQRVRESDTRVVAFINQPYMGYPKFLHMPSSWQQSIQVNGDSSYANNVIIPEMHTQMSNRFISHCRTNETFTKPLFKNYMDGYVVRMPVSRWNTRAVGYLAGNGEFVIDPAGAYLYRTREAAEKIGKPECWRSYRGSEINHMGSSYAVGDAEIITADQWREELFGPCDGINYYYRFARGDYSKQPN